MNTNHWAVTGAAGFLGSYLVEQLLKSGARVLALDNLATGKLDHLAVHLGHPNFKWIQLDIRDVASLNAALTDMHVGVMIHLAALHFIPSCNDNPPETISVNVHGTQAVLSASRLAKIPRFFLASTGDVYAPQDQPHNEISSPVGGFGIYGLSKLICEQLVALESRQRPEASFLVGRLFNLYGPRETNPHFLPEVLAQLNAYPGAVLKLGSLWPKRDLVPVADAASAIRELIPILSAGVTTVNIASGHAVTMQHVLDQLGKIQGRAISVTTDSSKVRPVERPCLQADVSQLKSILGWTPHTNLIKGLTELLSSTKRKPE